jgi:hypothetical protein
MIPIKIQCDCGQRYAFEIEPVGGRMPTTVACPTCGADGTAAANAIIAQSAPAQPILVASIATPSPAPAPAPSTPPARQAPTLRVAAPAQPGQSVQPTQPAQPAQPVMLAASVVRPSAPRRPAARLPGQVDRTQAEHEARAKISWGDSPKDVTVYLLMQGFSREEASELVNELFQERAKQVRAGGIRKIFYGIGLVLLPLVNVIILLMTGYFFPYVVGATVIAAFYGVWCIFKGTFMVLAPKSEPGDVAAQ